MKKKMTKREFEQIIALYEEARDFAKTTGKLKEILAKLEKVTVILQRLEAFQNLSAMLDLFEKQSWVMKEYLTIDEVAAYLDVSRWKIRRISDDKVLPIYKPTMYKRAKNRSILPSSLVQAINKIHIPNIC